MPFNIVEAIQESDADCAFDQPCKFGHRVEGHAVYCHNDAWEDSPRKCRRSWYTGGETRDEDCPGFQPNPEFKGEIGTPKPIEEPCAACGGTKLRTTDRERVETCGRCMGDGEEPHAVKLTQYEQDTLEMGLTYSGRHPAQFDYYNRISETKAEYESVCRLDELGLIQLRSISTTRSNAYVFLIKLTGKGDAVVRANWAAKKN